VPPALVAHHGGLSGRALADELNRGATRSIGEAVAKDLASSV
jgi:hypothetical protein